MGIQMYKLSMILFFSLLSTYCFAENKVINVQLGNIIATGDISKIDKNKYILSLKNNNETIVVFEFEAFADPILYGIQVIDIKQDGYDDLVIAYSYGNSPYAYTNLYEYSTEDKNFRINNEFPGQGFPKPSNTPECFKTEQRLPPGPGYRYVVNEWCYDKSNTSWIQKSSKNME